MSWLLERADFCSALIVRRLVALGSYSTRFPVGSARKVAHLDHHRAMDGRDHICTYFRALPLRVVPDVLRKCGLVRRRGNDFSRLIA